jgi:hypothetical protein
MLDAAWHDIHEAVEGKNILKAGYYCKDTGAYITTFPRPIVAENIIPV